MKTRSFFIRCVLIVAISIGNVAGAERRSPAPITRLGCADSLRPPSLTTSLSKLSISPELSNSEPIELLVAYTPKVLAKLGSQAALQDEIGRIIAYANAAHSNSGSNIVFSVVGIQALTVDATDNFSQDLQAATFEDGTWDELLTIREEIGADAVTVLVDGSQRGTLCGLAWTNGVASTFPENYDYMYSVVSISGTCTRDTLVHELGHNLGSVHARVDRTGTGSQPYSYGYRFSGASGQGWHTVMAIPGTDRLIPLFSTPLKTYDGVPVGITDSEDNVRSMALAGPPVANLVPTKGLPNLTATPPTEVAKVSVTYTKSKNRRQVKIVASPLVNRKKVGFQPLEVYFSQGRSGMFRLRAAGRSDKSGNFTLTESLTFPAGFFYRVCYPGYSVKQLCSTPTDLTKLK